MSSDKLGFLTNTNADYVADLYTRYLDDPSSVDGSWRGLFTDLDDDTRSLLSEIQGASWARGMDPLEIEEPANQNVKIGAKKETNTDTRSIQDSLRAVMLIRAYRERGHLIADLDPLGLKKVDIHPELKPEHYGFTAADYDRVIFLGGIFGFEKATLRQILNKCRSTYSGKIGVEYMHIQDPEQKQWLQDRMEEVENQTAFSDEGKKAILERLAAAEGFEKFLHVKYPGTKRFGIDGGEAMVPAIEQIMKRGAQLGLEEVVIGMPHRGRLNVLTNIMGKSFTSMFSLFMGKADTPEDALGSGDVKYHLGASHDREFDNNTVHLSLTANPSHLEVVNPVVVGKARAKKEQRGGSEEKVLSLLLHGDAAFAGQGLVAETLMLSEIDGYSIGGTIHFIVNNQIGFTTSPLQSRSGPYCTDVAKMIQSPIFHVNGDDAEATVHVARVAIEYRQKFKKDVVVDMYCYRRFGHNEGDEPMFTQPLMYKKIKDHQSTFTIYADKLVREGLLTKEQTDKVFDDFNNKLENDFKAAESYKPNVVDMLEGRWKGLKVGDTTGARRGKTGISKDAAQKIGKALTTLPDGFEANAKIVRQLEQKAEMFKTGKDFDWATAEALAFGSLLLEGVPVRLSGQDCERGTFSQRHSVLHDQNNDKEYTPLNNLEGKSARYEVLNSPLSEAAVLGFEYGYTLAEPHALVMWEAQFGDFVNGAQVLIDQFIVSGEAKWLRMSGLVMLLPHGYEGQGPEHSSARPERFLQLCAEDNMQVLNCSTPASYFHALRRQVNRDFRKPLIIMTPKSLLRHKLCVSPLAMMTGNETFHRVLYEDDAVMKTLAKPKDIKRVIICTGKVYYDLFEAREKNKIKNVTMLRLEQLYPFPDDVLEEELKKYPNAEVVWVQEEPENQGYWHFVDRRIEAVLTKIKHKSARPKLISRNASASTATGLASWHTKQQQRLLEDSLKV